MLSTPAKYTARPTRTAVVDLQTPVIATGWRRLLYLSLAVVTLACALIGVVLPGIPTTPFLLLTSFFLLRCSPRLHQRLLRSKLFGGLLTDWRRHRGIRRNVRTKAIATMLVAVTVSIWLGNLPTSLLVAMLAGAAVGLASILAVPIIAE